MCSVVLALRTSYLIIIVVVVGIVVYTHLCSLRAYVSGSVSAVVEQILLPYNFN